MHESVGALIERNGRYLMLRRKYAPFGLAGVAGHVDEGETSRHDAILREILEEVGVSGATVTETLVDGEEMPGNHCRRADVHRWYLYRCQIPDGAEPVFDEEETLGGGWFTPDELANEDLEPVWRLWFERLGIVPIRPRLVICGSMFEVEAMAVAAKVAVGYGWNVECPSIDEEGDRLRLARRYLGSISRAHRVVLWNPSPKTIGASSFAEVLFAAVWLGKPVSPAWPIAPTDPVAPELLALKAHGLLGEDLWGDLSALPPPPGP